MMSIRCNKTRHLFVGLMRASYRPLIEEVKDIKIIFLLYLFPFLSLLLKKGSLWFEYGSMAIVKLSQEPTSTLLTACVTCP
jgi:hypothetical protein